MANRDDLGTAISTQLQVVVASGTVIDLTNQRDADSSVDSTLLLAVSKQAGDKVRRHLGDVTDTDYDAIDFGVRLALLDLATFWSLTLTDGGLAYVSGVMTEMREEAQARRQANQVMQLSLEDLTDEDDRYDDVEDWDESTSGTY